MARPGLSYEQVAAAADALKAQGENVTIDRVRLHLGTGSKSTIHRYLRQWEDSRPTVAAAPVEMPPAIHAAIVEEIRRAVAETRAGLEQRLADIRATADELAQLNEDLETANDELTEQLRQEKSDNQQLVGQADELHREIDRVKADSSAQVAEIREQAAGQVQEARADAQRERDAAEQARQALARAELRLEAVPALEQQLADLRAQLEAERKARTDAEKAGAVAVAQKEAADRQADEYRTRSAAAEQRESQLRADLADLASKLEAKSDKLAEVSALAAQHAAERDAARAEAADLKAGKGKAN